MVCVVNMCFVKLFDEKMIVILVLLMVLFVMVEEYVVMVGVGSVVNEYLV